MKDIKKLSQFELTDIIMINNHHHPDLSIHDYWTLLGIAKTYRKKTGYCYSSPERLCRLTRISDRSIRRSKARLVKFGYIIPIKQTTHKIKTRDKVYIINIGRLSTETGDNGCG